MRTGKGKTFRINPKNVRGVRKTKTVFLSAGAGQKRCVTPLLYICNVILYYQPLNYIFVITFFQNTHILLLYKSVTLGSYIK